MALTEEELEKLDEMLTNGSIQQQRDAALQLYEKMDEQELERTGRSHWKESLRRMIWEGGDSAPEVKKKVKPTHEITSEDAKNELQVIKEKTENLQKEILVTAADVLVDQRIFKESEKKELVDRLVTGRGLGEGNLTQDEFNMLRNALRLRLIPVYRKAEDVEDIGKQSSLSQSLRATRWQIEIEQRLMYVIALMPREQGLMLVSPKFYEMWVEFEKRLGEMARRGQDVLISQLAILDARLTVAEQRYHQKPIPRESLIQTFALVAKEGLMYAYRPVAALANVLKKSSAPTPFDMEPRPKGKG